MEHLKAYILALKNMNTDFTIRIAQQSDALELMSLFQETVLHINKRDYSEAKWQIGHRAETTSPT